MTASHCTTQHASTPAVAPLSILRQWAARFLGMILAANALHRQRQALLGLNDALLHDIGVTRHEAITEANRPAWDAPTHWRG